MHLTNADSTFFSERQGRVERPESTIHFVRRPATGSDVRHATVRPYPTTYHPARCLFIILSTILALHAQNSLRYYAMKISFDFNLGLTSLDVDPGALPRMQGVLLCTREQALGCGPKGCRTTVRISYWVKMKHECSTERDLGEYSMYVTIVYFSPEIVGSNGRRIALMSIVRIVVKLRNVHKHYQNLETNRF